MKLITIGHALLIFSILLNFAGIAEPSAAGSAVAAALTLAAFAITVWRAHDAWSSGYLEAQLEMRPTEPINISAPTLFKCGMQGCVCKDDARFVEPQRD